MKFDIGSAIMLNGFHRLYKGLYPLWGRQIPYTMMKFASFETIVEMIYGYMPGKKSDYGRGTQTAVSFAGGYAGMPGNSGFRTLIMMADTLQLVFYAPLSLIQQMSWSASSTPTAKPAKPSELPWAASTRRLDFLASGTAWL